MCMTTAALLMFIDLLPPDIVTETETVVTIAAETGDVEWVKTGMVWCSEKGYDGLERP